MADSLHGGIGDVKRILRAKSNGFDESIVKVMHCFKEFGRVG